MTPCYITHLEVQFQKVPCLIRCQQSIASLLQLKRCLHEVTDTLIAKQSDILVWYHSAVATLSVLGSFFVSDTFENQNNLLLGFLTGFKHTLKVLELKMKKEGLGVRNMELRCH